MPITFIETLNGVSKEVEYLTPEEAYAHFHDGCELKDNRLKLAKNPDGSYKEVVIPMKGWIIKDADLPTINALESSPEMFAAMCKVTDVHKSNEGMDERDAVIYALDKGIISEAEYDLIYPLVMEEGLYHL